MTTELEERICDALRARAASTAFTPRTAPSAAPDGGGRRAAHRGLLAVAMLASVALLVGALAVASDRRSELDDATDPASVEALAPPGFGIDITDSRSTSESKAFAAVVAAAIEIRGWDVNEREDATRTTAAGRSVEWVYFAEPDARLFVALGDADLMDSVPDVRVQLCDEQSAAGELLVWPETTAVRTVALVHAQRTLIVRSEAIETDGTERPLSELIALAEGVAAQLDFHASDTTAPSADAEESSSSPLATSEQSTQRPS